MLIYIHTIGNDLIEKGDTKGLIELILNHDEQIIGAEIESDTVGCFQAVISIMFSLQGDHQPIVEKIITCLIKDTSNKISLRLKVLVCVFNMLVTSQSKLAVIKATFKYALDSSQVTLLLICLHIFMFSF